MQFVLKTVEEAEKTDLLDIIDIYTQNYKLPLNKKYNKILIITPLYKDIEDIDTINAVCSLILDNKIAIICLNIDDLYMPMHDINSPYAVNNINDRILSKDGRKLLTLFRQWFIEKGLFTELNCTELGTVLFGQLNTGLIYDI